MSANVEITIERLPRIRTDQTATLMGATAEDSSEVMLPIVRRVEAGASDFGSPQEGRAGE